MRLLRWTAPHARSPEPRGLRVLLDVSEQQTRVGEELGFDSVEVTFLAQSLLGAKKDLDLPVQRQCLRQEYFRWRLSVDRGQRHGVLIEPLDAAVVQNGVGDRVDEAGDVQVAGLSL